jgi:hypothetical protein
VLGALEFYRKESPRLRGGAWDRNALAAFDLVRVVQRLRPNRTTIDLHKRFSYWNNWVENLVVDQGLDLRREYWRALALSQDIARTAGLEARRLLPFWLNICGESGSRGRYDETYLTVGLLGLRRLPLSEDEGENANEEAALYGLARWAAAQLPKKQRFLREWRVMEDAFPRDPTFWTPLIAKVVATVEDDLFHKTRQKGITFPAAQWWREEVEVGEVRHAAPLDETSPPHPSRLDFVLDGIRRTRPFKTLQSPIKGLVSAHERYASRTGDTYYLMRTACNIGRQLLENAGDEVEKRADMAHELARLALRYEASDVFAWSLWRDALAALGQVEAAELVGWEAVRRFPEDPQRRNQLARFFSDQPDRDRDAEDLLRETIQLFPEDVVSRSQLAVTVGRNANRVSEALAIVREALKIDPENQKIQRLRGLFEAGQTSKLPSKAQKKASHLLKTELPSDIATTARARRALFRCRQGDHGAIAEVRRLFEEDENLAYTRYVAAATRVIAPSIEDTALSAAFLAVLESRSLNDLAALRGRAFGPDAIVLSIASAAMGDADAAAKVQVWLAEPVNDNDPRDAGLHAIAARPAASLRMDFLADMLAASLGVAIAA